MFRPECLEKCYDLEKGTKRLENKLIDEFDYIDKELFLGWYKVDTQFKNKPKGEYPMTTLRRPYQYMVGMLCSLYEK
jgi:hypothetical protein